MARNRADRFKPPSIREFQQRFPAEEDCARFLFAKRWPEGWLCPRCGGDRCYPIKGRG
ncbi:MAG: transposase, partial [Patescibacteria group bacterium]